MPGNRIRKGDPIRLEPEQEREIQYAWQQNKKGRSNTPGNRTRKGDPICLETEHKKEIQYA